MNKDEIAKAIFRAIHDVSSSKVEQLLNSDEAIGCNFIQLKQIDELSSMLTEDDDEGVLKIWKLILIKGEEWHGLSWIINLLLIDCKLSEYYHEDSHIETSLLVLLVENETWNILHLIRPYIDQFMLDKNADSQLKLQLKQELTGTTPNRKDLLAHSTMFVYGMSPEEYHRRFLILSQVVVQYGNAGALIAILKQSGYTLFHRAINNGQFQHALFLLWLGANLIENPMRPVLTELVKEYGHNEKVWMMRSLISDGDLIISPKRFPSEIVSTHHLGEVYRLKTRHGVYFSRSLTERLTYFI